MTMADHVINLSDKQVQWLDAILMDEDQKDALLFLNEVVKAQLRDQRQQKCGPKLLDT